MYFIDWQNGTFTVGDTTDTRGNLSGLEAVTHYIVTITSFTGSTVCVVQLVYFGFDTEQIVSLTWLTLLCVYINNVWIIVSKNRYNT